MSENILPPWMHEWREDMERREAEAEDFFQRLLDAPPPEGDTVTLHILKGE